MPLYTYNCEKCKINFEIKCSMAEYQDQPVCPKCKKNKKVFRCFDVDSVHSHYVFGLSECKTIGQYAEKQTKLYGEEKCAKMREEFHKHRHQSGGIDKLPEGMSRPKNLTDNPLGQRKAKKTIKNRTHRRDHNG